MQSTMWQIKSDDTNKRSIHTEGKHLYHNESDEYKVQLSLESLRSADQLLFVKRVVGHFQSSPRNFGMTSLPVFKSSVKAYLLSLALAILL